MKCAYVASCERQVRFAWGDRRYCSYHWHWTRMCGCERHRRAKA